MFLPRLTITKETTSSTTIDPDLSCRKICWAECSNSKGTLAKAVIKWKELARTIHQFGQLGRGAMHSKFKLGSFGRPDSWCCETSRVTTIWQVLRRFMQNTTLPRLRFRGKRPRRIEFKPLRRNIWALNRRQILSSHYISLTIRNL